MRRFLTAWGVLGVLSAAVLLATGRVWTVVTSRPTPVIPPSPSPVVEVVPVATPAEPGGMDASWDTFFLVPGGMIQNRAEDMVVAVYAQRGMDVVENQLRSSIAARNGVVEDEDRAASGRVHWIVQIQGHVYQVYLTDDQSGVTEIVARSDPVPITPAPSTATITPPVLDITPTPVPTIAVPSLPPQLGTSLEPPPLQTRVLTPEPLPNPRTDGLPPELASAVRPFRMAFHLRGMFGLQDGPEGNTDMVGTFDPVHGVDGTLVFVGRGIPLHVIHEVERDAVPVDAATGEQLAGPIGLAAGLRWQDLLAGLSAPIGSAARGSPGACDVPDDAIPNHPVIAAEPCTTYEYDAVVQPIWRVHYVVRLDAHRRLVSFTAVGSGIIDQLDVFWSARVYVTPA